MNNNKQQTAVEWLSKKTFIPVYFLEQAKELEKQQIMMAHCHNRCLNNKTYECSIKAFENSEQYYNETFNQQP